MGMTVYNVTSYAPEALPIAPLYPQAIILPIFAFPSWILCLLPIFWHFQQGNVAAGSLMAWFAMSNFFTSINPLIWPRDNLLEWWDGEVWCDIHVRIQAASIFAYSASTTLIVRKLANVMDTRNITVSSSRSDKVRQRIWELVWCWGFPLFMIIVYYVIQPVRYMLFGIVGCNVANDTSWPSVVLSGMWGPLTISVAAYYAVLLIYRLYRYRREFHRLVLARNTTSSRFIRLFIISIMIILVFLPYSIYLMVELCLVATDPYSWSEVHDPVKYSTILKLPVFGQVPKEIWAQVGTGYIMFLLFGTGNDAHMLYKKVLIKCGFGKIWPNLHDERYGGSRTPSSFTSARMWGSNLSSKAKSMFSLKSILTTTSDSTTRSDSIVMGSLSHIHSVDTEDTLLKDQRSSPESSSTKPAFLARILSIPNNKSPILPLFNRRSDVMEITTPDTITPRSNTAQGVRAHAWSVADTTPAGRVSTTDGVHVIREVHQDRHEKEGTATEEKHVDDWA